MEKITNNEKTEIERLTKALEARQELLRQKLGKTKAKNIIELLAKIRAEKGSK